MKMSACVCVASVLQANVSINMCVHAYTLSFKKLLPTAIFAPHTHANTHTQIYSMIWSCAAYDPDAQATPFFLESLFVWEKILLSDFFLFFIFPPFMLPKSANWGDLRAQA